ncbi:hypothetical protein Tco_1194886 [Tanacetum coccineum]
MPHKALAHRPSYLGVISHASMLGKEDERHVGAVKIYPAEICLNINQRIKCSSLLTGGQQRGIISPFGAMHAGSSLLTGGQQRGIISPFGAMHAGSSLLIDGQQRAMHAGSSLLTGGQQRGIISPWSYAAALISFDRLVRQRAMHARSSLLTGGQQRGINCFRCYGRWLNSFDGGQQELFRPFGACSWLSLLTGVSKEMSKVMDEEVRILKVGEIPKGSDRTKMSKEFL